MQRSLAAKLCFSILLLRVWGSGFVYAADQLPSEDQEGAESIILETIKTLETEKDVSIEKIEAAFTWANSHESETVRIAALILIYLRGWQRQAFEMAIYRNLTLESGRRAAYEAAKLAKTIGLKTTAVQVRLARILNSNFWNPSMGQDSYDLVSNLNVAAAKALGLSLTFLDNVNAMKLSDRGRMVLLSQILNLRLTPLQISGIAEAQELYNEYLSTPAADAIKETRLLIEVQIRLMQIAGLSKQQIRVIFLGGFVRTAPEIRISFRSCEGTWL